MDPLQLGLCDLYCDTVTCPGQYNIHAQHGKVTKEKQCIFLQYCNPSIIGEPGNRQLKVNKTSYSVGKMDLNKLKNNSCQAWHSSSFVSFI